MTEMLERVAKAIWAERVRHAKTQGIDLEGYGERVFGDGAVVSETNNIMGEARAAIEAMREPTQAMLDAARQLGDPYYGAGPDRTWPAMIDEALRS